MAMHMQMQSTKRASTHSFNGLRQVMPNGIGAWWTRMMTRTIFKTNVNAPTPSFRALLALVILKIGVPIQQLAMTRLSSKISAVALAHPDVKAKLLQHTLDEKK